MDGVERFPQVGYLWMIYWFLNVSYYYVLAALVFFDRSLTFTL